MEVMGGATPKGLEEAGVGETPLLEMVLPGVTAMPGAGDEPEGHRDDSKILIMNESFENILSFFSYTLFCK